MPQSDQSRSNIKKPSSQDSETSSKPQDNPSGDHAVESPKALLVEDISILSETHQVS